MKHLPPFDSLVAFDAVVRHKSITRAAAELGLTQSAISHRVRRLEAFMSAPLLHRHNTGLQSTSAGEALVEGFDEVAGRRRSASSAMPYGDRAKPVASGNRRGVGGELARASPAGFCGVLVLTYPSNWSSLRVRRLNLIADLDLRILWVPASELKATSTQLPLFQERVFPVCHPSLLPPNFSLGYSAILATLPLLHKGPAGRETTAEWSWPAWLERLGLPPQPRELPVRVDRPRHRRGARKSRCRARAVHAG